MLLGLPMADHPCADHSPDKDAFNLPPAIVFYALW